MNDRLKALADAGVSIWLDDLSRERLETGNLADLVESSHVVGVTSNPAIFQAALADGERYDAQVRELAAEGIDARVVSMPCREWFDAQEQGYRDSVIPPIVKARVSVEAGIAQGWREVVGDHGRIVSLDHFGASADYARIYKEFGITADAVAQAAKDSIAAATA